MRVLAAVQSGIDKDLHGAYCFLGFVEEGLDTWLTLSYNPRKRTFSN